MVRNLIKKIIKTQHKFLPLPFFFYKNLFRTKLLHKIFYKYYFFIYHNDLPKKKIDDDDLPKKKIDDAYKKYWLSKRSLYWHYTHIYINRFDKIFKKIYQEHSKIFINKRLCDPMAGFGSVYFINKLKLDITFIEHNKYCCKFLRKKFPQNKVFNENWSYIKTISDDIDTLLLVSGCLTNLNENEIEDFFKITKNIKNFLIINDGADKDIISSNGLRNWDLKSRLKKYNNHYKNSKIYIEKKHIDTYHFFLMISN